MFTPYLWCIWHLNIVFYFSFTRCSPMPWIFAFGGFSSVSNLDSLSRDPLLRVLLKVYIYLMFLGGVPKRSGEPCNHLLKIWLAWSIDYLGALRSCFHVAVFPNCSCLEVLPKICLLFTCVQGGLKLSEGMLRTSDRCHGKYSPFLIVLSL